MTDPDLDHLVRTALPASVRVGHDDGQLLRLSIEGRHGAAQIYFQGAHVTAWRPTLTEAPVLWMSRESHFTPGKAIRGGVPICFPWFGAHATDASAPAHGFARLRDWTLIDAREDEASGDVAVTFELTTADPAPAGWPHRFRATHRITVGSRLTMALEVTNTGETPFTFEEALHTYFGVQDIRSVTITGLDAAEYLDKAPGAEAGRRPATGTPIAFTAETDRVYLATRDTSVVHDPGKHRRLVIAKHGSEATVVWNPWIAKARAMPDFGDSEWTEMVCVETCNVNVHRVTLEPGGSHTMLAEIAVAPL